MTHSEDSLTDSTPISGTPAGADSASERPSDRWAGVDPVRVGWIVDAQRGFLDAGTRCRVVGGGNDQIEVTPSEAAATLTRAVEWMARQCPFLVYTQHWPRAPDSGIAAHGSGPAAGTSDQDREEHSPDGEEHGRALLIDAIRPPDPLVLERNADDERAENLGYHAAARGRAVVAHRKPGGGFEEHSECEALLAAVEDAHYGPLEIIVAGVAWDGTVARIVEGLLSHGHRVTVVRDAVFMPGARSEPETEPVCGWAGGGTVVSLAQLRDAAGDSRQISFADLDIAEAHEHLDRLLNTSSNTTPSLAKLDAAVPWELFRAPLEASRMSGEDLFRDRDPLDLNDALVMFKSILLGAIYDLSDEHLELLLHDRLSFKRFAGLGVTDEPPRARFLRIHRQRWAKAGVLAKLVLDVNRRWEELGWVLGGMRSFLGLVSSELEGAEAGRPEVPGSEPELGKMRKGGGGKKRLSRKQRRKRRRRRR